MKLKICCIKSIDEARLAIDTGAKILGLVGPMPSGPGSIQPEQAKAIVNFIPNHISSFYLTSKTDIDSISSEYNQVRSTHIQLTDQVSHDVRLNLKSRFPKLKVVQVIHVRDEKSIEESIDYALSADLLLLDSGSPDKAIKELGGTGRVHNWDISKRIIEASNIPVFLAGGIKADNAMEAIEKLNPYGLDVCSGVRTNDQLDPIKLTQLFKTIQEY